MEQEQGPESRLRTMMEQEPSWELELELELAQQPELELELAEREPELELAVQHGGPELTHHSVSTTRVPLLVLPLPH